LITHSNTPLRCQTVQVGLALPQYDFSVAGEVPLDWSTVASYAREAERVGFDSLWLADHLTLAVEKYGAAPGEHRGIDPITGLSALARITARPQLGTLVLCAQIRPVTVLAKQLAGVDVLSGGRLIVGIGAGWHEPDYAATGVEFKRPGQRLAELAAAVEALRIVWRGAPGAPPCLPPPVQDGGPPVWIGGRGDRLLGEVARHADGWNMVWAATPAAYRERLDVLHRACEQLGRDPAAITRSLGLFTLVGEDEADLRRRYDAMVDVTPGGVLDGVSLDDWRRGHLVGTVEQVREQVGAWAELGVAHLVIGLGAVPFQGTTVDDLEMIRVAIS
jgi:alkanesulfonate monooxygenase SsuD/methylene tetrahydromethanopterin reductase-like flavin-dependent oxidoreductase (luciferase family)